jgi:hypothetical protein
MHLYCTEVRDLACDVRVAEVKPDCASVRKEGLTSNVLTKIKSVCKYWDVYLA